MACISHHCSSCTAIRFITFARIYKIKTDTMTLKYKVKTNALTLEYKPFVGIIRQTDERGFSTYFTYDNSGRLIEEYFYENDKKMILKKYSYHYQTE